MRRNPVSARVSKKALILLASLLGCLALLFQSSASTSPGRATVRAKRTPSTTKMTADQQGQCCGQGALTDQPHYLAASYYTARHHLTPRLLLNNKGPQPVEVKPTLFSLSGARLDAPSVVVDPESFRFVDLRDLGAVPGSAFEEGSLELFHRGPNLVVGAQLYLVDEEHSLSFDEKLAEFGTFPSTRLESVWWVPSPECEAHLALSNTSGAALSVRALIKDGSSHPESKELILSPHETRLIDLHEGTRDRGAVEWKRVGSASISHSGSKGALLARTLISNARTGYSWSAQFIDPGGAKSSGYQGVGLRLADVGGEHLTPVVVAHNAGDAPSTLTGTLPYTLTDGSTGIIDLPRERLRPGEVAEIDVARAISTRLHRSDFATAGLEFEYTGAPGTVVMSAESVSTSGNQVFRVPMWDVPAQRNGTGGYPWYVDGSSSTLVYIKNVTAEKQTYTLYLTFDGGVYATGRKTVEPHQTVALDLRALRDNQTPDERGRKIPLNAARGKLEWSVRGPNSIALLGRSEQADVQKGISSSYACFMCCPNSFGYSFLEPDYASAFVGLVVNFSASEQDHDCYGSPGPPYYMDGTWSSDNSSVATVDDDGNATGLDYGATNISCQWDVYEYSLTTQDIQPVCETRSDTTSPSAELDVGGVTFIDTSEVGGSNHSDFVGGIAFASLNIAGCGGERFGVKIRFRLDANTTISSFDSTVSPTGMFAVAPSPVDGTYVEYYGNDNPPYTITYLRKVRTSGNRAVTHTLQGTSNGKPFKSVAVVTLVCQ
jgi:Bacterial Ig-like domain (group 2)